ncbi:MAG: TVP38/TMEM64 family protein [Spirochaetia bacterium]|jgi:uncharacterized membrane protein YdjX (TVP38/TMEM64 family)|nr:TVP38/TMEM64 family protein [Spirochaetia bacterium]
MKIRYKITLVLLFLLIAVLLYIFTPLGKTINLQNLLMQKENLLISVRQSYFLSAGVFIALYIAVVSFSIPGAVVMSLLGGFFFGPLWGTLFINIGATTGALCIFLAARYILGNDIQHRYREKLASFNREIDENGRSYMLTLRLLPVFPFFLINLFAGFTAIPARTFIWTTSLGIIPGSFVFAYLGYTGANAGPEGSFGIQVITALALLGLLSLLPVLVKRFKKPGKGTKNE